MADIISLPAVRQKREAERTVGLLFALDGKIAELAGMLEAQLLEISRLMEFVEDDETLEDLTSRRDCLSHGLKAVCALAADDILTMHHAITQVVPENNGD